MAKHVVGRADEIEIGGRKRVSVRGRDIVIFNVKGEFFALFNRCPHEGATLSYGPLVNLTNSPEPGVFCTTREKEILRCPWHGWEFDLRNGQSYCDPDHTFVRVYDIKVEPGATVAKGPFVAETFEVRVEDDYLVIEM